jgi:hypothetical protein
VSNRAREPFKFDCQECGQEISGVFLTDQTQARVLGLTDMSGADLAESESDAKYYHQYHPDFAIDTTSPTWPGGLSLTPFMEATMRHGPEFMERMRRVGLFREAVRSNGNDVVRTLRNFRTNKLKQYDEDVTRLGHPPIMAGGKSSARVCALSAVLRDILDPLFGGKVHGDRLSAIRQLIRDLADRDRAKFNAMLTELTGGPLPAFQYELLEVLSRFLRLTEELRAVLPEWNPEDPDAAWPAHLKVTGQSRFHDIKAVYVDAYEAIARGLTVIVALQNLRDRGDPHSFPPHPDLGKRFAPKDIFDFHKDNNAPKLAYLRGDALFELWFLTALDPKLRNAIGHYSAVFEPAEGSISYISDKKTGAREVISYAQFLRSILRVILCCYELHEAVAILLIYSHHSVDDSAVASTYANC